MNYSYSAAALIDETVHTLMTLAEKGSRGFDCSEHSLTVLNSWAAAPDRGGPSTVFPPERIPLTPRPSQAIAPDLSEVISADRTETSSPTAADCLERIIMDLGDCRRCKLSKTRTHIVFGAGNPSAALMFVGEAPGFDEDLQGLPFVGKAGQLLSRIIQAMNLTREQVYICNVIKCRPPGNRNPQPDEILACSPFLTRQIATISPKFICALGTFAAQTLLKTTQPISGLRGRFHDFKGIRLLPTFHPSYLLRNPDKKREVWEDMKRLMNEMTP